METAQRRTFDGWGDVADLVDLVIEERAAPALATQDDRNVSAFDDPPPTVERNRPSFVHVQSVRTFVVAPASWFFVAVSWIPLMIFRDPEADAADSSKTRSVV